MNAPAKKAAPRPTLVKKQTRATKAKTDSILDEGYRLVIEDEVYEIRAGDLNGLHARALRQQVGVTFPGLVALLASDYIDVDMIAAWIWLHRFANGEDVSYDTVAAETGYDVLDTFTIGAPEDPTGDDTPEG